MSEKKMTSIGGQAVIEGVMMRGPYKTAVAVNPAFMTAFDYDETEGNWKQLYEDVDRNFVNPERNRTTTSAGSINDFTRIIRAEFLRYKR